MKKFNVNLTPEFENELDTIYLNLLFKNHNLSYAKQFFLKVRKAVLSLSVFPERYSKLSNFKKYQKLNIRKLIIGNYLIIYRVDNKSSQVFLLHIFHGNQDYLNKL